MASSSTGTDAGVENLPSSSTAESTAMPLKRQERPMAPPISTNISVIGKPPPSRVPMPLTLPANPLSSQAAKPHSGPATSTHAPQKGKSRVKASASFDNQVGAPLSKSKAFISKSHENLSSFQKGKLSYLAQGRPKSTLGLPKQGPGKPVTGDARARKATSKNKENLVSHKDTKDSKATEYSKSKISSKLAASSQSSMRKASSTQSIDKAGSTSVRSAVQNKSSTMKRAASTQNVGKDKFFRANRTSAPTEVLTYNAELLANFEKEKKTLESRISELLQIAEGRKAEIEKQKIEIRHLKDQVMSNELKEEVDMLRNDNKLLLDRLKELGHPVEQITDSQKLSMLKNHVSGRSSTDSRDSTMPQSISFDNLSVECTRGSVVSGVIDTDILIGNGIEHSEFIPTSDMDGLTFADICKSTSERAWDKQSNKSSDAMSEMALQNLTERILEMEETNYSTTEELQATLQELGDLQDAVNRLQEENEDLAAERDIVFQSLHTQTKKLQNCRTQIEQLKTLLIGTNTPDQTEKERQLEGLLLSAQEEREELLVMQKELSNGLYQTDIEHRELQDVTDALKDKVHILEEKLKTLNNDKSTLDVEVTSLRESLSNGEIELTRYKTLLENEKTKVSELEQYRSAADKSDLEELLHSTRTEKDKIEAKLANVQEALSHSQCEIERLKDQLTRRDEELTVTKRNTVTQIDVLDVRLRSAEKEKEELSQEVVSLRDHIDQLDQDCDRYIEERKLHEAKMTEFKEQLRAERLAMELKLCEANNSYETQTEEWKQFQKDLQVAVVIANDIRTEKEDELERINNSNDGLKEKCRQYSLENNKLRDELQLVKAKKALEGRPGLKSPSANLDKELVALREGRRSTEISKSKDKCLSVKGLINTIEEQVKNDCPIPGDVQTRRNSDSSETQIKQNGLTSPVNENGISGKTLNRRNTITVEAPLKSVLKRPTPERSPLQRVTPHAFDKTKSPLESPKSGQPVTLSDGEIAAVSPGIASLITRGGGSRRNSQVSADSERKDSSVKDPLSHLTKQIGGSKRNALLKWCQQKTVAYRDVDITNFSSSWNDGLAFCALLHNYLPDKIPYSQLTTDDKKRNFRIAFEAAESVEISSNLDINDMTAMERPDWQAVMSYVTLIYKYFELDKT